MRTSFHQAYVRPPQPTTAAVSGRRVGATSDNPEVEAKFSDLLPDEDASTDMTETATANAVTAVRSHARRAQVATANVPSAASVDGLEAQSVRQAMLTAPAPVDDPADAEAPAAAGSDESTDPNDLNSLADGNGTAISTGDTTPTARPPLIAPHGPVTQGPGDDFSTTSAPDAAAAISLGDSFTVAEITADASSTGLPLIAPHGPVTPSDDQPSSDPVATDLPAKLPPIAPHGPVTTMGPTVAADPATDPTATDAVAKPTPIAPHGPVNVDPPGNGAVGSPAVMDASVNTVTISGTTGDKNSLTGPQTTTILPSPAPRPHAEVAAPASTVQVATASTGSPTNIPVRTAAQAQLAASAMTDATATVTAAAEISAGYLLDGANLAASTTGNPVQSKGPDASQDTDNEELTVSSPARGTGVAKVQTNVNTATSNSALADASDAPSQGGADGWAGSAFGGARDTNRTGRAKDGDAATALTTTGTFATTLSSATAGTAVATASASPSNGVVQANNLQTLMDTVQQTAQQAKLDGSSQVELKVKLNGVADDVTVRIQLDANQQSQVTFQTGSPELRAALEQGWSDLAGAAASTASTDVADAFPDSAATASSPSTGDSAGVASGFYREGRRATAASGTGGGSGTGRWSGYA